MLCLVIQATKPQEPQKCPNSRFLHPRGVITHERILKRPEIISELQREAYGLARQSVHTCMAILQAYGALGLPMCHIFTVSGSSLPVPIFIGRWIDHINLQAEVTVSGTEMPPTWSDMNRRQRHLIILSCQSNRLADATFSKSGEASYPFIALLDWSLPPNGKPSMPVSSA